MLAIRVNSVHQRHKKIAAALSGVAVLMLTSGCGSISTQSNGMLASSWTLFIAFILLFFLLGLPLILAWVLLFSRSWLEKLLAILVSTSFVFYYSLPLRQFLFTLGTDNPSYTNILINRGIRALRWLNDLVFLNFPEFEGVTVLGRDFFGWSAEPSFDATAWPIVALYSGILIRYTINKFVPNPKLRQVAREYWLFITTYVVFAAIISSISTLSFWALILILFIVVFLFTAGIVRVINDGVSAIRASLKIIWEVGRTFAMYLALAATRLSKLLRRIIRKIVELYERFIVKPLQTAYNWLLKKLERFQQTASDLLNQERLDD